LAQGTWLVPWQCFSKSFVPLMQLPLHALISRLMHGILERFLLTLALCLLMASQVAQHSLHLSSDVLVMLHHPPSFSRRSVCWGPGLNQTPITSKTGSLRHSKNTCPLRQYRNLCVKSQYCIKHSIFWHMIRYSVVEIYEDFGATCYLQHHGRRASCAVRISIKIRKRTTSIH